MPTRNEADNVSELLRRLLAAAPTAAEIIFVDDSDDGTAEVVRAVAMSSPVAVRVIERPAAERSGGLGGAVVAGMRAARSEWVVVLDGDLQHPPEVANRLFEIGHSRDLDLVVASRRIAGGSDEGLDGAPRRAVSNVATALTKVVFPRRLARTSDPLSGLFAIRLGALDLDRLRPSGFKILLELLVRTPGLRIGEVPFAFGPRHAGESKASTGEGVRFMLHMARLRGMLLRRQVRRASADRRAWLLRAFGFGLVGLTGVGVNLGVLALLTRPAIGVHYLVAAALATEASTTWLFALTELVVFRGGKPGSLRSRGLRFFAVNHVALLLRLPVLAVLVDGLGLGVLVSNALTLVLLFLVRFVVADTLIYGRGRDEGAGPEVPAEIKEPMRLVIDAAAVAGRDRVRPRAPGYLTYRYDIPGVATIGSQFELPELEYFRAQWLGSDLDIRVRIGTIGRVAPRKRATMTQLAGPAGAHYEEHIGRLGANFRVELGDPIDVVIAPPLANSPHVAYTNVMEALLRFVAVSKGVMLLHAACMELDGTGFLLSARTDTGKTGTVLKMLRDNGARFLSDDMTIIHPDGRANCFPKPLTISHHTLRAVDAGELTRQEWRRLRLQSRLHSKEGRQFALLLAQLNLPIMGVNSIVQRLVPPPKYVVDRLVPCRIIRETTVSELFVIERSARRIAAIEPQEALRTLLINTDDAYGFPPFRQFAPSIVLGGEDYAQLRRREEAILAAAMTGVHARHLCTPDYTWAQWIHTLLSDRTPTLGTQAGAPRTGGAVTLTGRAATV